MTTLAPTRIICISHVPWDTVYGAGTSLRYHWKILKPFINLGDYEVDLVIRVGIKSLLHVPSEIGDGLFRSTQEMVLPFAQNYEKGQRSCVYRLREWLSLSANELVACIYKRRLLRIISERKPDVVHLNSHVLSPLAYMIKNTLGSDAPFIVTHVRDFVREGLNSCKIDEIRASDCFVCIDTATKTRLISVIGNELAQKVQVITNPFNAQNTAHFPQFEVTEPAHQKIRFAIVGGVNPEKGVLRVCEAFIDAAILEATLYVLGSGVDEAEVQSLADISNGQCRFLGEFPNLSESGFFNDIDVIVRGDRSFRTGRTVYEALFSGAAAVLPGTHADMESDPELNRFKEKIFFFEPKSTADLVIAMRQAACHAKPFDRETRLKLSNHAQYSALISDVYGLAVKKTA